MASHPAHRHLRGYRGCGLFALKSGLEQVGKGVGHQARGLVHQGERTGKTVYALLQRIIQVATHDDSHETSALVNQRQVHFHVMRIG